MKALMFLLLAAPVVGRTANTHSWALSSPEGGCSISVVLDDYGRLRYQVARDGRIVIPGSPMGLRRDDQDFAQSLEFDHAGEVETRLEKYELFASVQPQVDHILNHRSLVFRNTDKFDLRLTSLPVMKGLRSVIIFQQAQAMFVSSNQN